MAERTVHKISDSPLFIYCGVDMFGPFLIKHRRNEVKSCGGIFTCMGRRVLDIEITRSLDTYSFI